MGKYKDAFLRHMDSEGIKYTDLDEVAVRISYNVDNVEKGISVVAIFDKDDSHYATFRCWDVGSFDGEKKTAGMAVCNEMNKQYRWCKFFMDDEGKVTAQIDAIFDMGSVGPVCLEMVRRMVNIVDEAYPAFMKVRWG